MVRVIMTSADEEHFSNYTAMSDNIRHYSSLLKMEIKYS